MNALENNEQRNKRLRGVYLIMDTVIQQRYTHVELARCALEAGVHLLQYRDKKATGRQMLAETGEIATMARQTSTTFLVNDRSDFAVVGDADGVHVGQEDLPVPAARLIVGADRIVGGTSSTLGEALQVEQDGADYVALGHIFETSTKQKDYPPRGLGLLKDVCEAVSIPVVAIGGITIDNAPQVIEAGADIIAVCSPVCTADDPAAAAARFVELFE